MPAAYLKLPGIKGASTDAQFKEWIPIESYQFNTNRRLANTVGITGGDKGPPPISEIVVTKLSDISTPSIQQAAVKGTHFPVVLIRIVHPSGADGTGGTTMTLELHDVIISSWNMGGSGGAKPSETITLNFREFSHKVAADPEVTGSPVTLKNKGGSQPVTTKRGY